MTEDSTQALPKGDIAMQHRQDERAMRLTEEEAMGLLELALACPMDLSSEQRSAIVKLSEFCRQGFRMELTALAVEKDAAEQNMPTACAA